MAEVTILYFASVREAVGIDQEQIDLPSDIETPRALVVWLSQKSAGHSAAFGAFDRLRCAVDQAITPLDQIFSNPQEIAFFPPVTGG